ncbi:vWA domain-containing protein [Photobacterium damselae]|uniref:VWA domain-containing protein n=1 Tax=Photobacterium damselae subsp. damselae TaxID=85581 RepID=A0AAD3WUS1_PHODD|nr:vWA domain-containing protein [Photobacterium damselae]KAB1179918.1 VWA domain-containing protein [Photobacterium damselae subsp. damselae]
MNTQPKLNSIQLAQRKKKLLRKFALIQRMTADTDGGSFTISGTGAYTNGSHINLPLGDFNDPEYLDMLEGMLDHENGHCKHTNFGAWRAITDNLTHGLSNLFEDLRIEKLVGDEYPGAKSNLENLVKIAIKRKMFDKPRITDTALSLVQKFFLYRGRTEILGQTSLNEYSKDVGPLLQNALPNSYQDLCDVLKEAANNKSSADAIATARKVIAILKQELQEQEDQQQDQPKDDSDSNDESSSNGNSDDSSNGESSSNDDSDDSSNGESSSNGDPDDNSMDESSSNGDSDDNSNDESSSNGDSDDNSNGDNSSNEDSDESSDGNDSSNDNGQRSPGQATIQDLKNALNAKPSDLIGDLHKAIEKLMEEKAEEAEKEFKSEYGRFARPKFALESCKFSLFAGVPPWITRAGPITQRMRQVLNSVVYAHNKTERSYERSGNTIAAGELWGVSAGNSRIFQNETRHRAPNAAFQILVDKSGSMTEEPMVLANIAAYSIASAIEFIKGAECEVLYYPVPGKRLEAVHIAKAFNEKMASCRNRSFNITSSKATPTAEALLTALSRIGVRKEPKKVIFLITDGDTDDCSVNEVLKDCDAVGVDVIGIGIGTEQLAGFEDRPHVSITDANELAPQLFNYVRAFYQK